MKAPMTDKAALAVGAILLILLPISMTALAGNEDWLDAMTIAVRIEQAQEGPFFGTYEPYLGQLEVVRAALRRRDEAATYAAMNRFMDMLEARENGIPPEAADWLFDYCYLVTPAQFHDVSRHIRKFKEHQFGEPVG